MVSDESSIPPSLACGGTARFDTRRGWRALRKRASVFADRRARWRAVWLVVGTVVGLACGGDPVERRPDNVRGSVPDAGRSIPADAAQSRPAPGLDARIALPIEDPKPVGDAALSGPSKPVVSGPGAPVVGPGTPAASDAAVADADLPGNVCDAKVGGCGSPTQVNCDAREGKVTCKRTRPSCPEGQVPAVVETCWGECVGIEQCACTEADACPERETYVCHMSARHCGPYVN